MFTKAVLSLAVLAVAQQAIAQPYCLLTAVNKLPHPADQKTLCCSKASDVKNYISQLCPSADQADAVTAFNKACSDSGYGTCSSASSSSSTASQTGSASASATSGSAVATSAPYPITYTSTYYDTVCGCTKTTIASSTVVPGSTGFAVGTAPIATGTTGAGLPGSPGSPGSGSGVGGAGSTGSPIVPVGPSKTGSSSPAGFTGAATKNVGSVAAGLLAVAGVALAL